MCSIVKHLIIVMYWVPLSNSQPSCLESILPVVIKVETCLDLCSLFYQEDYGCTLIGIDENHHWYE